VESFQDKQKHLAEGQVLLGVGIFAGLFAITEKSKAGIKIDMEKNRIEAKIDMEKNRIEVKTDMEVLRKETQSEMQRMFAITTAISICSLLVSILKP
jgi:hypothetical protein